VSRKNPWLAASLSLLLPGTGHFYGCFFLRGTLWLLIEISAVVLSFVSLLSTGQPLAIFLVLSSASVFLVPLLSSFDSWRQVKVKAPYINTPGSKVDQKEPWLAVFMSLLWPGLGHVYLRRWFFSFFYIALTVLVFVVFKVWGLIVEKLVCACAIIHVYYAVGYLEQRTRPLVYFLIFMLAIVAARVGISYLSSICVQRAVIQENSMEPTLEETDVVVIDKVAYIFGNPQPGDIVAVIYGPPDSPRSVTIIKRIAATGGETVQFKEGRLYVDGSPRVLDVPKHHSASTVVNNINAADYEELKVLRRYGVNGPYKVCDNCFFLLGDNLEISADSRIFGSVPREAILGKVVKVILPVERSRLLYSND
jgi:signal peptidase I